jgi:hypothetical protein
MKMANDRFCKWAVFVVGILLVLGIARASNSHYAEQRTAFFQSQEAESQRLGLTDRKQISVRYPTPEIKLCHPAHLTPGTTANLTVRGKFVPGSKFLFENDDVEVVKENATAAEYQATLRVPSSVGPGYSPLHVFAAVSGYEATCPAVYIGGKYEWDFTAQNGWRIKLHPAGDTFPTEGSAPEVKYTAEFYRGNESKPFEVREFGLGLGGTLYGNSYSGGLTQPAQPASASGGSTQADMQKLMQKLMDPNTSVQEKREAGQQLRDLQLQGAKQLQSMQQQGQEDFKFQCQNMNFSGNADPVEGELSCGPNGTLKIKGTRRFVGP